MNIDQLNGILDALPDPAFILSHTGKYVGVFGGRDSRYYHDGRALIGQNLFDVLHPAKANWFIDRVKEALDSRKMMIVEYELNNRDVIGLSDVGPGETIWFEGRVQALDFDIDGEPVALWVASNISARHQMEEELRNLSETDQLTGLANRRKLEQTMAHHFSNFQRYGTPTSVLMLDLDNLKTINDTKGHKAGDELLSTVADICTSELRETDLACRYGGDEYVIILTNTGYEEAVAFARRLHMVFQSVTLDLQQSALNVLVSMGVTSFNNDDSTYEEALHRADGYLYKAKRGGRNQVVANL